MESTITFSPGGVTYTGIDGFRVVQLFTLWSSLNLYVATNGRVIPTRGMTISKMLRMAESYTGKKYKRGQASQAAADVKKLADELKAAIPQIVRE